MKTQKDRSKPSDGKTPAQNGDAANAEAAVEDSIASQQNHAQRIMAHAAALMALVTDQYQRTTAMTQVLIKLMLNTAEPASLPPVAAWTFRRHQASRPDYWRFAVSVRRLRQIAALAAARQQNRLYAASGLHKQAAGKHEAAAQHHREAAAMHEAAMPEAAQEASNRAQHSSDQAQQVSEAAQPKAVSGEDGNALDGRPLS
ncbi:hypothetical protein [Chitinimonas naiadis]